VRHISVLSLEVMSEVRQRRVGVPDGVGTEHDNWPPQTPKDERKGVGMLVYVALSYLAVGVAYLALRNPQSSKPLPQSYAICSRNGANIYTVDKDNPQVQCFVVDGDRFIDVGELGTLESHGSSAVIFTSYTSVCHAEMGNLS
jgi:hypothetical protein